MDVATIDDILNRKMNAPKSIREGLIANLTDDDAAALIEAEANGGDVAAVMAMISDRLRKPEEIEQGLGRQPSDTVQAPDSDADIGPADADDSANALR